MQRDTPGYIADGPAPKTVCEDRRVAMGVPKWYLYIGCGITDFISDYMNAF